MKKWIKEYIKCFVILFGYICVKPKKNKILVSMLVGGENSGPGRFIRNLSEGLSQESWEVTRNPFSGARYFLIISSTPPFMYAALKKLGVITVLRVDGFSYPDLYDNETYSRAENRREREFTADRIRTNFQVQMGLKYASKVVFQSDFSRSMANKWLYNRKNHYSVAYNGVDVDFFKPCSQNKINSYHVISIAGNLRDVDILECSLLTFERLLHSDYGENVRFRIIGSLTEQTDLFLNEFLENELALKEVIELTGAVDINKLAEIIPKSSVLLHLTSADACPNVVLESLACGVPVVCQGFGGQVEIVGDAGIVIDSGKKYDYSRHVAELASDACIKIISEQEKYSDRARKRAVESFSLDKMASSYLDLIVKNEL